MPGERRHEGYSGAEGRPGRLRQGRRRDKAALRGRERGGGGLHAPLSGEQKRRLLRESRPELRDGDDWRRQVLLCDMIRVYQIVVNCTMFLRTFHLCTEPNGCCTPGLPLSPPFFLLFFLLVRIFRPGENYQEHIHSFCGAVRCIIV